MPRRTNREQRKSSHSNPGRNLSARARAERDQSRRDRRDEAEQPPAERRPRAAPAPSSLVIVCPSGKLGWTKATAEAKLAEYQAAAPSSSRHRHQQRVYPCPKCSTPRLEVWHLTSEKLRDAPTPPAPRAPAGAPDPVLLRRPPPPAPPRPEWMH